MVKVVVDRGINDGSQLPTCGGDGTGMQFYQPNPTGNDRLASCNRRLAKESKPTTLLSCRSGEQPGTDPRRELALRVSGGELPGVYKAVLGQSRPSHPCEPQPPQRHRGERGIAKNQDFQSRFGRYPGLHQSGDRPLGVGFLLKPKCFQPSFQSFSPLWVPNAVTARTPLRRGLGFWTARPSITPKNAASG